MKILLLNIILIFSLHSLQASELKKTLPPPIELKKTPKNLDDKCFDSFSFEEKDYFTENENKNKVKDLFIKTFFLFGIVKGF
jgi:hypothetical protein